MDPPADPSAFFAPLAYLSHTLSSHLSSYSNSSDSNAAAVSERLLDVVDMLLLMRLRPAEYISPLTPRTPLNTPVKDCPNPNNLLDTRIMMNSHDNHQPSPCIIAANVNNSDHRFDVEMRKTAVRRLLVLADVLTGSVSLADYDSQFGEDYLPT